MKVKELILDILFPKFCIECGKEGKYICNRCEIFMLEIPQDSTSDQLDGLICFWEYNGVVKKVIHKIKYEGAYDIIKELITMKNFDIAEDAFITYVPMYKKKKRQRGFNQAEIIAKELGKRCGLPVVKLLEKTKQTKDQAELDKEERLENIKDSFRFCTKSGLTQRKILLVDDVFITGATMKECCRVLKKSGIKNVWGFTLARMS